mmetsp:Transcript_46778/g.124169  ORF Transcript_46778/g.124169 Transcript_46778/m.124169 type:complete len:346 (+) Transcript_46778:98-1135(+)
MTHHQTVLGSNSVEVTVSVLCAASMPPTRTWLLRNTRSDRSGSTLGEPSRLRLVIGATPSIMNGVSGDGGVVLVNAGLMESMCRVRDTKSRLSGSSGLAMMTNTTAAGTGRRFVGTRWRIRHQWSRVLLNQSPGVRIGRQQPTLWPSLTRLQPFRGVGRTRQNMTECTSTTPQQANGPGNCQIIAPFGRHSWLQMCRQTLVQQPQWQQLDIRRPGTSSGRKNTKEGIGGTSRRGKVLGNHQRHPQLTQSLPSTLRLNGADSTSRAHLRTSLHIFDMGASKRKRAPTGTPLPAFDPVIDMYQRLRLALVRLSCMMDRYHLSLPRHLRDHRDFCGTLVVLGGSSKCY